MKVWKIAIALFCILFAVFGLLETFGVTPPMESMVGELSFVRIVCAVFLAALAIKYLCQLKLCKLIFTLSLLFMTVESNIAYLCGAKSNNLINNGTLFLYTILICFGLSLILPKRRKKGKWGGYQKENGIHHDNSLGSRTIYIDCTTFTDRFVENNLGSTVIMFENTDAYSGGGCLHVENNLGSTVVRVPDSWSVDCRLTNHLGGVQNRAKTEGGPVLTVQGENNLGSTVIQQV
ncbi:MAG: hypothetical protein IJW62_07070 [Clostridia bacterium]|nr:hypothetical protein [Clostridia bacterium]